jgi:hypothetical protein
MKMKAQIVVMSHLSDAQHLALSTSGVDVSLHINFAKYIIMQCNGDLNQEIDPDAMFEKYQKNFS